ncbi:MAG TPA: FAD-dependent monooxygenase [Streptosporangiaceae bacterium]|nr:FAD-dependent monooxygenase [Streptosporangiaceae bacterium]
MTTRATNETADGVVIVGAGPAGLAAALCLRARGIAVTVLEAEGKGRVRPGSRALFVHRDSLRILEAADPGLGRAIAEYGLVWQVRRTLYRGRQIFVRTHPAPPAGTMPPFTSLRQVDTERFLLDACEAAGVRIVWDARADDVILSPDCATVCGSGGRRWSGAYVIGADGARSAVRRAAGIPALGSRTKAFHVVLDVEADEGDPMLRDRVFHYRHPRVGGRNVLRVPFTGGFQIDLQCAAADSAAEWGTEERAREWITKVVDASYVARIRWVSTYRFLRVVAENFTDAHRRILLIGEAAHLFPPFGARGMNSAFADAAEAAAAIERGFRADADGERAAAIEEFALARRSAALRNAAATARASAHLDPGPGRRFAQAAAAALAPLIPACGRWMESAPYAANAPAGRAGTANRRY